MKAIVLKENGSVENFTLAEIAKPEIKPDEVLVHVKAISINPVDAFVRQSEQALQGILNPGKDESLILGWDISGTVTETGSNVSEFKEGDDVFGMVNFPGNGKAYAEYLAAPADQLAKKPQNISFEEAAAATLAALTAWQALVTYAKIKEGDNVLIHAAAGGVGHYAVQMAKYFGASVVGTASFRNRDFVLGLGADEFVDYTSGKFEDEVKDADIVLDSVSTDNLLRSMDAVKEGGRVLSIKGTFNDEITSKAEEKGVYTHRMMVQSNGADMKQIATLLGERKIHSHVSQKFEFKDLPKAHQQIETRKTRGKIVVVV